MGFIKSYRRKLMVFLAVCFTVLIVSYLQALSVVPGKLTLLEGEEYVYNFRNPFMVDVTADKSGIIKLNDHDIQSGSKLFQLSQPIHFKTQKKGVVNLSFRVFGLIPLKTMQVDIMPNKKIIACGNTIGVKMEVNGVLVIGMTDIETVDGKKALPAKESGLKTGDVLTEMNNTQLKSVDDVIREIDSSNGEYINVKFRRGNTVGNANIKPVKDVDDKKYHIGLWVRDGTAGIGTLTFYDPENRKFGALGHGITDIDTGILMPVKSGEILESNILAVRKGQQGNPGELKGVFVEDRNKLGTITKNCESGIYGELEREACGRLSDKLYPIALRNQIKEGPATILANIDGSNINEYSIVIEKVSKQNISSSKGMIIKITDKKLLEDTGGIVQGMSGSPIIQNGKVVGAVTHVLVNDPTRGYGIFIEWMLQNMDNAENIKAG